MARKKLSSRVHKTAIVRLSRIKAIPAQLEFSDELSVTNYQKEIDRLSQKLETYNGLLASLDRVRSEIKIAETALGQTSTLMLQAIGCQFGLDSLEYKQAGGVRRSERKRPVRQVVVVVEDAAPAAMEEDSP